MTLQSDTNHALVKPFLRWAGGKSWLINQLGETLRAVKFKNYHEPFLGGGSLFFFLLPRKAILSDANGELINAYAAIRDDVSGVIDLLKTWRNDEKFYYYMRAQQPTNDVDRAARFIYLNQTSFNGIFRVNLNGIYNVPYGFRKKDFIQEDTLKAASIALSGITLCSGDFSEVTKNVGKGDLVFFDPPYTVTHNNNGFIKYNQNLFSLKDQHRLAQVIDDVDKAGAFFIMTNAAHAKIRKIFEATGHRIRLDRQSLIGGTNASRGRVSEYLFTNIPELS